MDKAYADTVRLLLRIAPEVFRSEVFALKGGTAINLFVRDMPRLSVDIDAVYTPLNMPRHEALAAITKELMAIRNRLIGSGLSVIASGSADTGDRTLLVNDGENQVKVEVNIVFRGTVLPVQRRSLVQVAADQFSAELELPTLAVEELYGSKLVAAFDRQHPRDLFDAWAFGNAGPIPDTTIECFVTYLAGHDRPMHEVLFGNEKDIALDYHTTFVGMTTEEVPLETLLETRKRLFHEIPARLTENHREFLIGLAHGEPDWSLLACPHASSLPAIQWKLVNLKKLQKLNPRKFEDQATALEAALRR